MLIDHVIFAVPDLDAAAEEMVDVHGLASVPGGRHLAWGTANRVVPMGENYLEIVSVVDAKVAAMSSFGRWVMAAGGGLQPLGWAVRTHDLSAVSGRLGLSAVEGSRRSSDGRVLEWELAGLEEAVAEPNLPFFIQWGSQTPLPGRMPVVHPVGESRISSLHLTGEVERMRSWLAGSGLPVAFHPGPPAVTAIDIVSAGRTWVLSGKPT